MVDETGVIPKSAKLSGAQTNTELVAAPGTNRAIRVYLAQVVPVTGMADIHPAGGSPIVSGAAGGHGKQDFSNTPGKFHQLAANTALQITSTGDVAYNLVYEVVRTGKGI